MTTLEMKYDPNKIYELPMGEVYADESFNSRGQISPMDVIELAREIKENGLVQPVTVQPYSQISGKKFRIVAGYRRYKAHEVNSAITIRAVIKEGLSDLDARVINLTENLQRKDLNIVQESKAIYHLKIGGWSQDMVAQKIGKSRGWVQTRFQVLDLPQDIQEEAANGTLNQAQIKELWSLGDYQAQIEYVRDIKDAKLLGKKRGAKAPVAAVQDKKVRGQEAIFEMQDMIQEILGLDHISAIMLGWAAGVVDSGTAYEKLSSEADQIGKKFDPPEMVSA